MTRILRGLTSEHLACGCTQGVYETYDGRVIAVIDARGDACRDREHALGRVVDLSAAPPASAPPFASA
jgi:hypothetical protein